MSRSSRISLLFFIIFLVGILGVIIYVNKTLNKKTVIEYSLSGDWANTVPNVPTGNFFRISK